VLEQLNISLTRWHLSTGSATSHNPAGTWPKTLGVCTLSVCSVSLPPFFPQTKTSRLTERRQFTGTSNARQESATSLLHSHPLVFRAQTFSLFYRLFVGRPLVFHSRGSSFPARNPSRNLFKVCSGDTDLRRYLDATGASSAPTCGHFGVLG
jgi:hypothetical protein